MHDKTVHSICVRHRLFGWLPGRRWHLHLSKPTSEMGADDAALIAELCTLRWWVVTDLGTGRRLDS
jgi:hypothetical protein